jgi:RHS repeat-associated protein
VLTAPTIVRGTVQDATLVRWSLERSPRGATQWTTLATGTTTVTEEVLGTFDPILLLNDLYDLRLSAEDANGRSSTVMLVVRVTGNMKVGHLSFTLQDLTIPVVGLPITVNRTYDSRDPRSGDFGHGWRLDVQSVTVRKNRVLGTGWQQGKVNTLTYCVEPQGAHYVTITLPDGRVEAFDLTLTPACQTLFPIQEATTTFTAQPGTFSTLEAVTDNTVLVVGALAPGIGVFAPVELVHFDTGDQLSHYDPVGYQLTTAEGLVLDLDQGFGVQRLTEPNGHTVPFGPGGLVHSAGPSVLFTRDAQGRITTITDPLGHTLTYTYDTAGDLVVVTDPEGYATRYTYDSTHKLVAIADPRGMTVARTLYDEAGRVVAHLDAEGHRIDYTHDIAGRQAMITDRLGQPTLHVYDDQGNVLRTTDPLGHTTTFTYDAHGNLLTQTDPLGHTTTSTYDSRDNMLTQTDALGHTTTFTYNTRRQRLTRTDPLGHTITWTYDANGNVLTQTDALGQTTTYTYSLLRGLLIARTDPLGHTTRFGYDAIGRREQETDPLGHVTRWTYDANGNHLTTTTTRTDQVDNAVPLTTRWRYDARNRVTELHDALGFVTFTVYDALGKKSASIDGNGYSTVYVYDTLGRLARTQFPDGTEEIRAYNANQQTTQVQDRAGQVTAYAYDALQRLVTVTDPQGNTERREYDAAGRWTALIDAHGHRTTYAYDPAGRRTRVVDALGQQTRFTYDARGDTTQVTDVQGGLTIYTYDALRQRTSTRFPDGTERHQTYDARGQIIATIDQAGGQTTWAYDAGGRLVTVVNALGDTTVYTYDTGGNLLTQHDANGHTTRWTYDGLDRMTSRTLPLGMQEHWTYDALGNAVTYTTLQGATTQASYDSANRLVARHFPDDTHVHYTYVPSGQLATVTDGHGVTTYQYDPSGRLATVMTPEGVSVHATYDAVGNRTSVTTPSMTLQYTYDPLHRLQTVTDADGGVTTYAYDGLSKPALVTFPQGMQSMYQYDTLGRLRVLEHQAPTGTLLARYAYTLDSLGNRVRVEEQTGREVTYRYNAQSMLLEERIQDPTMGTEVIGYTYDAVGNRLTKTDGHGTATSTYDANDRLVTVGGTTYTYDANGNVVQQTTGGHSTVYTYDWDNRLTAAQTADQQATYRYTTEGLLVGTTVDGVETVYVRDAMQPLQPVLEERDATGAVRARYVYGQALLSQERAGHWAYYLLDGGGSTRLLADAHPQITDVYTYDAFGNVLARSGDTPNAYLFAGEPYDPVVGAHYLRARYYHQALGRFLSLDPVLGAPHDPLARHPYLYAQANPVNRTDPTGLATLMEAVETSAFEGSTQGGGLQMLSLVFKAGRSAVKATGVAVAANLLAPSPLSMSLPQPTQRPILLHGLEMPATTQHVIDAITSVPPWGALTRRQPAHKRTWLESTITCGANYGQTKTTHLWCDEYPFASTEQGGEANGASLRLVPDWEQSPYQRDLLRDFYNDPVCNIVPNNPLAGSFEVYASQTVHSGWICDGRATLVFP